MEGTKHPSSHGETAGVPQSRFPWAPLLLFLVRGIFFTVAGAIAAFVWILLADQIRLGLFRTMGGNATTFLIAAALLSTSAFAGILGGIFATSFIEGKSATFRLRDDPCALALSHKVMLIFVAIPLLSALISPTLFATFSPLPLFGASLITSALGYPLRRQFLWTSLAGLSFFWMILSFFQRGGKEPEKFAVAIGLLGIVAALVALISQFILIQRSAKSLKASGMKVGLLGVPFREIAANEQPPPDQGHPAAKPDTTHYAATESSRGFYYLGPNNEPIGPVSQQVLLQLRDSGAVNDESLIAPEGESEWQPLRSIPELGSHSEKISTEKSQNDG